MTIMNRFEYLNSERYQLAPLYNKKVESEFYALIKDKAKTRKL